MNLKDVTDRLSKLETENSSLKKQLGNLETRTNTLEKSASASTVSSTTASAPAPAATPAPAKDDDDSDLFGDEEETEEEKRIKAERLAAYDAKKAKSEHLFFGCFFK